MKIIKSILVLVFALAAVALVVASLITLFG